MISRLSNPRTWNVEIFLFLSFALSINFLFMQRPLLGDFINAAFYVEMAKFGTAPLFFVPPVNGLTALAPNFIFYGGQFYYVLGLISELTKIDSPLIISLVVFSSLYIYLIGAYKICRYFNLSTKYAIFSSIIFLANPYYLTNLFHRYAFNEFVAQSLVVLTLGLILEILSEKVTKINFMFLSISFVFLFSVHTLTIFLFTIFCLIYIPIFLLNKLKSHKNFVFIFMASIIGFLLNFEHLLLIAKFSKSTWVAFLNDALQTLYWPRISSLTEVFFPLLHTDPTSGTRPLFAQTIFVINVLLLIAILNLIKQRQFFFILLNVFPIVFFLLLSSFPSFYSYLPSIFFIVQFPYRYVFYLTLSIFIALLFFYNKIDFKCKDLVEKTTFILLPFSIAILLFQSSIFSNILVKPTSNLTEINPSTLPTVWMATGDYWDQSGLVAAGIPSKGIEVVRGNSNFVQFRLTCSLLKNPVTLPITGNFNFYNIENNSARIVGNAGRPASGWLGGWLVIDSLNCVGDKVDLKVSRKINSIYHLNLYYLTVSIGLALLSMTALMIKVRDPVET